MRGESGEDRAGASVCLSCQAWGPSAAHCPCLSVRPGGGCVLLSRGVPRPSVLAKPGSVWRLPLLRGVCVSWGTWCPSVLGACCLSGGRGVCPSWGTRCPPTLGAWCLSPGGRAVCLPWCPASVRPGPSPRCQPGCGHEAAHPPPRYDIKGCRVDRWAEPASAVVLKDLNFEGKSLVLGKAWGARGGTRRGTGGG